MGAAASAVDATALRELAASDDKAALLRLIGGGGGDDDGARRAALRAALLPLTDALADADALLAAGADGASAWLARRARAAAAPCLLYTSPSPRDRG